MPAAIALHGGHLHPGELRDLLVGDLPHQIAKLIDLGAAPPAGRGRGGLLLGLAAAGRRDTQLPAVTSHGLYGDTCLLGDIRICGLTQLRLVGGDLCDRGGAGPPTAPHGRRRPGRRLPGLLDQLPVLLLELEEIPVLVGAARAGPRRGRLTFDMIPLQCVIDRPGGRFEYLGQLPQ